ncbi:ferrochelatase [Pelagibius sp. Alg239-R121]|uniref:ferrochelatase n=1 Tax=Pelagibius sp. Alg239-R121 TaxID=2993448 RepID=UPI002AC32DED|nr:ferrochelatase [Pelagibius sp. Alg239-R121]
MTKTAIVLFNLGGPDTPAAVQPFLFNLFNDPAIIRLPNPFRWGLAKVISKRRAPIAREIYENLGGGSPLLPNTKVQAKALEAALMTEEPESGGDKFKTFIAMRYWHPFSDEAAREVKAYDPDQILLLPLYPQFSTTTTGSSVTDWNRSASKAGLTAPTKTVCCYPSDPGFVSEVIARLRPALNKASEAGKPRVLFSAHGLPKKIVEAGDPYQEQVEESAAAVVDALNEPELDWVICYQSRVGPLEWIGPSTDSEIERAGQDKVPLVVVPIAFVSEHSETLVELDIEYRELAEKQGVPAYIRVPTVNDGSAFIEGLARRVRGALDGTASLCPGREQDPCPTSWNRV